MTESSGAQLARTERFGRRCPSRPCSFLAASHNLSVCLPGSGLAQTVLFWDGQAAAEGMEDIELPERPIVHRCFHHAGIRTSQHVGPDCLAFSPHWQQLTQKLPAGTVRSYMTADVVTVAQQTPLSDVAITEARFAG